MKIPQNGAGGAVSAAAVILAGLVATGTPAQATEGYFQHGFGALSKMMAGTGAAYSQDAMSQALNPAGLVGIDNQLNADLSFFSPHREFDAEGGSDPFRLVPNDKVKSDREIFFIPSVAASYQIDDLSAVGVALYGNGGMNTSYDGGDATCSLGSGGVFCDGTAGVDLMQAFLQFTYAREIPQLEVPGVLERFAIGVGPIVAYQRFEAKGLSQFGVFGFSSDPSNLTNNGHDESFGLGARFGIQAELPANVGLGVTYQLRTYMDEFDDYKGLFAEQGDFDIPPALQVGVSWNPIPELTLLFDYKRIWYNDVDAVGNEFSSSGLLGDDNGPGFGWENTNIFKFGAQWQADEQWMLRAGYSYTDQPIDDSEVLFNILAPAVMEHHITGGVEYKLNDNHTLQLAGMFAPETTLSGRNPLDSSQKIKLKMYQYEVTLGYAWHF
ncbi:MAG: outer membrane protein transport protein [Rhodospirillales bacterium]|nr:outer membrane protein transport protein [Rhodospirillales bacterium]MDH3910121.1 outer membrane protein transport protein [Rhodospirillales bacterium]MDH3916820.1 outer membrane protein transport protein [Rhodospirillales bacterium]MDH3965921.1 outer membrane protein transport protein [Rhodospirillales bacterium]